MFSSKLFNSIKQREFAWIAGREFSINPSGADRDNWEQLTLIYETFIIFHVH